MNDDIEKFIRSRESFRKTRIPSLYSDFSNLKELNPEGFAANIDAWCELLVALIKSDFGDSKTSITVSNPEINQYLSLSDQGKPLGMKTVFQELVSQKQFIPLSLYQNNEEIYSQMCHKSSNFAYYLNPKSWIKWTLDSIGLRDSFVISDASGKLINERYIYWEALLEISDTYYNEVKNFILKEGTYSSKLHDKESLYNILNGKFNASMVDIDILLVLWSRDIKICKVLKDRSNTYIKFDLEEISESDIGIINLQNSIVKLENRNKSLEKKVSDLMIKIKSIIHEKSYHSEYIKKLIILKKTFNKSLLDSIGSLHQLNIILESINDANANNEIYNQLVKSSKILSQINSNISLGDIDNIKMDIDEQIQSTNLVTDSLVNNKDVTDEELETELETELEALVQEVKKPLSQNNEQKDTIEGEEIEEDLINKLSSLSVGNSEIETSKIPILEEERN